MEPFRGALDPIVSILACLVAAAGVLWWSQRPSEPQRTTTDNTRLGESSLKEGAMDAGEVREKTVAESDYE
ncbi:MAG: hypothetical protein K6T26_04160 [Alicyclobacillus sp.]|nr:hypothetical protein [Alicyclobacillus sp.]